MRAMNAMQIVLSIILWLLIGAATAYFANQRGRDPLVWFMAGMLLGFLGLLLLFLLPTVNEEEIKETEYNLLQDPSEKGLPLHPRDYLIKDWYYYDNNQARQGPVPFENLQSLWNNGYISQETFVWSEGMNNWKKVEELPNLFTHLQLTT